jgi:cell wall assembly regulator SMI1
VDPVLDRPQSSIPRLALCKAEVLGMPEALTADQLDELAARWRALDASIAHSLEPGLSEEAIEELGQSVGLWVPAEARTLWGWRNGANLNAFVDASGHTFGSLQHAVEWTEMMRRIAHEIAAPYGPRADKEKIARDVCNWDWLPLSSDFVGGMLLIDAGTGTRSSPTSPVGYKRVTLAASRGAQPAGRGD